MTGSPYLSPFNSNVRVFRCPKMPSSLKKPTPCLVSSIMRSSRDCIYLGPAMDIHVSSASNPWSRILPTCAFAPNRHPGLIQSPSDELASRIVASVEAKSESNFLFTFQTLSDQSAPTSCQPSSMTYARNGAHPRSFTSSLLILSTASLKFSLVTPPPRSNHELNCVCKRKGRVRRCEM